MKILSYLFCSIFIITSPFIGYFSINFANVLNSSSQDFMIFWDLRIPRVFLAFFCGGLLSLGGLLFQSIFKNPLITPYTLGLASGSTLFAALCIIFLPSYFYIGGFLGAFSTIILLFIVSSRINKNSNIVQTNSILLIGIALSFFYSACLSFLFAISNLEQNYSIVRYTLGSLDIVGFSYVFPVVFVSLSLLWFMNFYKNEIALLLTSHNFAFLKGVEVRKTEFTLLLFASFCIGLSISFTGPIGFVGLVIPHIVKLLYKQSAYELFFPVFFFGGFFLVFCDFIARNIIQNSSLPIGVVTAIIGAPFLVYLIIKRN